MTGSARAAYNGHDMNVIVGRRFHMLMWDHGESQTKLGKLLGLAQSPLSKKLRGISDFDLNEILWLCDHYGVDVAWMLRPPEPSEEHVGRSVPDGMPSPDGSECAIRDSNPEPADMANVLVMRRFRDRHPSRRRPRPNPPMDPIDGCISQIGN